MNYPPNVPNSLNQAVGGSHPRILGNSCLLSHTIYSQQVKEKSLSKDGRGFSRAGEGKRKIERTPIHPISVASETGVSSQQERCSRDTEILILSPGRWQGGGDPSSTGAPGYRSARSEASSGGLAGAHRCSVGTFASGADLR